MKTGREFFLAIRTTIPNERVNPGLDDEAAEVLDRLAVRTIGRAIESTGIGGDAHSLMNFARIVFFEGALRGTQIQLLKHAREEFKREQEEKPT